VLISRPRCYGAPSLTTHQISCREADMRALVAAAIGLVPVLLLVLLVSLVDLPPDGPTSPRPLLTADPGPKK
ncbi:SPW_0924 family protein, partial [Streptomyces roseolus]|uniref:SPW_0924 family protein n=1 Tax=Streptomyces roseolus TaxID=67358 RepID=UPI003668211E